jgi:glutamate-1-semialdehyde 2,1-aminomutase
VPHVPTTTAPTGFDLDALAALKSREDRRFVGDRPQSLALRERARRSMPLGVPLSWMAFLYDHPPPFVVSAEGATFTDVDGHRYDDFSLGITVASAGHTPEPVIEAAEQRMRAGTQFLLPTEDAIVVAEELVRRWGLPKWQFALTSSQAVSDVIRLARAATRRERIVVFEGKYHGHVADLLAIAAGGTTVPEYDGITPSDIARTTVVPWNDLEAVSSALTGDVALLLAEPALTNSGIVMPTDGFHAELRRLTSERGIVLAIDETQTLPMAYGGLVREWGLEPDAVIVGKSLGGGIPVSAYGFDERLAAAIDRDYQTYEVSGEAVDEPAIGGTLYGNALSLAAARAALEHVWTEETYARTGSLALRLADGLRKSFRERSLAWDVYRVGNRAGYRFHPEPPRTNSEACTRDAPAVRHLQRVYLANRGIWDFGWWGGPAISAQTTVDQVDRYLAMFDGFIAELMPCLASL